MRYLTLSGALVLSACVPAVGTMPVRMADPVKMTIQVDGDTPVLDVTRDDPLRPASRPEWPASSLTRSASGEPGPGYWQQRADYRIEATLDTAARRVSGTVRVTYTNNSPDTLRAVWMQLDQNLYRPGSKGSAMFSSGSRWGVRGFRGGYDLDAVQVDGASVVPHVDDTMMRLELPQPLMPRGAATTITMRFAFNVPEHGSDRMGRDGTLYEIAQWYPRMAVYDDVRGWNTDPYLGQGEFYLEYGDIDYSVTAPAGYTLAGSGLLQNATEVLSESQRSRLAKAATSKTPVAIITRNEARATPTSGTKTWRFRAERVRDVAWAAAPDFQWDAVDANGVLCQAYFQPDRTKGAWDQAAEQTQWTINTYSSLFHQYPYPQATSVAGPVAGMEYPMFVMVEYGTPGDPKSVFGTIDHEHGHEWYPMLVGSNERRYAWQDEGFNTFINIFSNERRDATATNFADGIADWRHIASSGMDVPLMTPPDHIAQPALGAMAYDKPAIALMTLRNHVLGPEIFDRAFREYTRRWAFKHPTPGDFFRTMENVSGRELGWFWRGWWYTTATPDIGIERVTMRKDEDGSQLVELVFARHSEALLPPKARLKYADGSTEDIGFPIDVWAQGATVTVTWPARAAVVGVRLWPTGDVPDWNHDNDTWGQAPAADAKRPVSIPSGSARR